MSDLDDQSWPADADHGPEEPGVLAGFGPVEAPTARHLATGLLHRDDIGWRFRVTGAHGQLWQLGTLPTPHGPEDVDRLVDRIRNQTTHTPQPAPPAETDPARRTPGPALARWIRARDGTCRAPGCRTPASVCDIDHTTNHTTGGKPHTTTSPCYAGTTTASNTRPAGR
jgi:hypothetical protein